MKLNSFLSFFTEAFTPPPQQFKLLKTAGWEAGRKKFGNNAQLNDHLDRFEELLSMHPSTWTDDHHQELGMTDRISPSYGNPTGIKNKFDLHPIKKGGGIGAWNEYSSDYILHQGTFPAVKGITKNRISSIVAIPKDLKKNPHAVLVKLATHDKAF